MESMKQVTRYQCQFCKKDFKTPDRHHCKFNPGLKNCFTCKYLKGWYEGEMVEYHGYEPPMPDCIIEIDDYKSAWTLDEIKEKQYNMQCPKWKEGKYEWTEQDYSDEADRIMKHIL